MTTTEFFDKHFGERQFIALTEEDVLYALNEYGRIKAKEQKEIILKEWRKKYTPELYSQDKEAIISNAPEPIFEGK